MTQPSNGSRPFGQAPKLNKWIPVTTPVQPSLGAAITEPQGQWVPIGETRETQEVQPQEPTTSNQWTAKPIDNSTAMGDLEAGWNNFLSGLASLSLSRGLDRQEQGNRLAQGAERSTQAIAKIDAEIAILQEEQRALFQDIPPPNFREKHDEYTDKIKHLESERDRIAFQTGGGSGIDKTLERAKVHKQEGKNQTSQSVSKLLSLMRRNSDIPINPTTLNALNSDSISGFFEEAIKDPVGVARTLSLRTLPAMLPVTAAGIAGALTPVPGAGPVAAGVAGFKIEEGASITEGIMEALSERGININEPQAVEQFINDNPEAMEDITQKAMKRAGVIGATDAATFGLVGTIIRSVKNSARSVRFATAAGTGTIVEPTGEAGGEALAQIATEGEITKPGEVAAEAVAGTILGGPSAMLQGAAQYTQKTPPQTSDKDSNGSPEMELGPSAESEEWPPIPSEDTPPPIPSEDIPPPIPSEDIPKEPSVPSPISDDTSQTQAENSTPQPEQATPANRAQVYTPDNEVIEVETLVVEANDLLTSDQKGYPQELQPRNRDRAASQVQIEKIASDPNPARLDQSPETDRGAPIVAPEGNVVESGNGRVMALRKAYNEKDTAANYRAYVVGKHPEAANMQAPILIRRRISDVQRTDFVSKSNQPATMQMSAVENAQADARLINDNVLNAYKGGNVQSTTNRPMIRKFIAGLSDGEQNALTNARGGLSVEGLKLFTNALFHRAYGDPSLLNKIAEDPDPDMRSIFNALQNAAPIMARLNNAIEAGRASPKTEIASHIVSAMQALGDMRRKSLNLKDFRAQIDAFAQPLSQQAQDILDAFHNLQGTRLGSQRKMLDFLNHYASNALKQNLKQGNLPNVEPEPIKDSKQLTGEALAAIRSDKSKQQLFEARDTDGPPSGGPRRRQPGGASGRRESDSSGQKAQRYAHGESRREKAGQNRAGQNRDSKPEGDLTKPNDSIDEQDQGIEPLSFLGVSKNQKEAIDTQAYVDAGFTPDQAQTLPPQKKKNILVKLFKDKFDIAVKFEQGGKKLEAKYAIDQLLDAYRGIRFMGHVLGLPRKAFSLESTLSLVMEKGKGVYLGMYDPATKSIHMPDRSNAFAHEWFHALDHFLRGKMKPQSFDFLTSHVTRNEGLDPSNDAQSAFINLVHKIFFDETDLALKVLSLETQAEKKTQAGTPTKEAQEAAIQLEKLHAGMTRIRIKPSEYRAKAKNLDKGSGYWSSAHEMLARAFEAYTAYKVEKAGGQNAFITKGDAAYLSHADARLATTFPKGTERLAIFEAFDQLFDQIRASSMLGEGTITARPTEDNIVHKTNLLRSIDDDGTLDEAVKQGLIKSITSIRNVIKNPINHLKKGSRAIKTDLGGEDAKKQLTYLGDSMRNYVYTLRGTTKGLIKRQPENAQLFMRYLADQVMTDPGSGRTIQETVEEKINRVLKKTAIQVQNAIKKTSQFSKEDGAISPLKRGIHTSLKKEDNDIVRGLLLGRLDPKDQQKAHVFLASKLREIMDSIWQSAKVSGLKLGYVENTGYIPRVLNYDKVIQDQEGFVRKAENVYRKQFDSLVENIEPDDLLKVVQRVSSRLIEDNPFRNEVKAVKQAVEVEDNEAIIESMENLKASMRDIYAEVEAKDWLDRILIGKSISFDSVGPNKNFSKNRKLPPEADTELAAFYVDDVIENTLNYALFAVSKAAHNERLGATDGNKRFEKLVKRRDVRDAINDSPGKYNIKTPEGRFAIIRDLSNKAKDNIVELMIAEAVHAKADPNDIRVFRNSIHVAAGLDDKSFMANRMRAAVSFVYNTGTLAIMNRTGLTSLPEPIVAGFRTRDVQATLKTLLTYIKELNRHSPSTKELAEFSNAIGIITTPLYDIGVFAQGGLDASDAIKGSALLSGYYRAIFLAQITNASRRSAAAGGIFWFKKLATQYLDKNTKQSKRDDIKAEFRDLGLRDGQMQGMANWLTKIEDVPDISILETPEGEVFEQMLNRFVRQTIQEPGRADKPIFASTPMGKLVYALTSFSYTFFRNIVLAAIIRAQKKGRGASVKHGAQFTGAALALFGAHAVVETMRQLMFNPDYFEERLEKGDLLEKTMKKSFSRAGIIGPWSIPIDLAAGIRWGRDLDSIATGPFLGFMISHITNIYNLFGRNSRKSNTAEHNAIVSAYMLMAAPSINFALATRWPYAPLQNVGAWGLMTSHNNIANKLADTMVGEKDSRKKR